MNFKLPSNASPMMSFASYPGIIQSTDDFYITQQQLYVSETTNDIFNNSLYNDYISPETVSEWIRVTVANRMATSGSEWSTYFSQYNSGTYNNQWQIVDYKLFTPGKPLPKGTLWILEQVPGFIVAQDETSLLNQQGFWPSYNIPYFPMIYNISGYPAEYQKYGNEYSYTNCPRALIFKRDAPSVTNMDDMKRIMRSNDYQSDPYSLHDACKAVAARCDLNTPWGDNDGYVAYGAIDCKITDQTLIQSNTAWAVSGPAWYSQPPFAWNHAWTSQPQYGLPEVYDFDFELFTPANH
jgi:hypothetical protein